MSITFSEMPYQRPDIEQAKKDYQALTARLKDARDYPTARLAFIDNNALSKKLQTQATLASVRHSIDTRDPFYNAEEEFWNLAMPELQEYTQLWTKALLESPFRNQFEEEYGKLIFVNAQLELESFSPAIIPELQQENQLVQEYEKLIASAQIPFENGVYTHSQLTPFKSAADDDCRLRAWKADGQWYKDNQEQLDAIYDKLVALRDAMGKKLGGKDYVELGYKRMQRNCYNKNDVEQFRTAVQKYIVPVADKIYRRQAERLGKSYPLSFADEALTFRSGNPRPVGTAEDILNTALKFYTQLSPETGEFFSMMMEGQLLDVLSTEGKRSGGYCTSIHDYGVPFIFANFNGTQGDVEVVTHEAGHAFAGWMNRERIPMESIWPSLEACEVHSMSMEFFAWPWSEDFFGEDARKFRYSHLSSALTFIPYGTMVDHFQHIIYENPQLSPRERHDRWKELLGIYMPWMKLDGEIPMFADGEGWQRQSHIYANPFYYIDYCLAQTLALEFWSLIQDNPQYAWERYMAYTRLGGSLSFRDLLENARLPSPFEENTLRNICAKADSYLDHYDLSGIA